MRNRAIITHIAAAVAAIGLTSLVSPAHAASSSDISDPGAAASHSIELTTGGGWPTVGKPVPSP